MKREFTEEPHNARRRRTDPDGSDAHFHRRNTDKDAVVWIHERLDSQQHSIDRLIQSQLEMAEVVKKLNENAERLIEILNAWNNIKGFWLTIKFISSGLKVLLPIGALLGAIWVAIKTLKWGGRDV